jgi:hypothetical protein
LVEPPSNAGIKADNFFVQRAEPKDEPNEVVWVFVVETGKVLVKPTPVKVVPSSAFLIDATGSNESSVGLMRKNLPRE